MGQTGMLPRVECDVEADMCKFEHDSARFVSNHPTHLADQALNLSAPVYNTIKFVTGGLSASKTHGYASRAASGGVQGGACWRA
jgi:hypothetical protein